MRLHVCCLAAGFLHLLVVSDQFGSGPNYSPPATESIIAAEQLNKLNKPESEMDEAQLCLSRLKKKQAGMYECLGVHLKSKPANEEFDYTPSLALWLHAFPREQVHIVQVTTCTLDLYHPELYLQLDILLSVILPWPL